MKTKEIEFRAVGTLEAKDGMTIEGYAIRFNEESVILGDFVETINSDALREVDFSDTQLLYNHNRDNILGRTSSETLRLTPTKDGLFFKATLPETTLGKDTYELIKRGDLQGMSFSMRVTEDEWDTRSDPYKRTVKTISEIREVSIVTSPAYPSTTVAKRSLELLADCKECHAKDAEMEAMYQKNAEAYEALMLEIS